MIDNKFFKKNDNKKK